MNTFTLYLIDADLPYRLIYNSLLLEIFMHRNTFKFSMITVVNLYCYGYIRVIDSVLCISLVQMSLQRYCDTTGIVSMANVFFKWSSFQ